MGRLHATLLACAASLAVIGTADGQCRVSSTATRFGAGAIDGGRALTVATVPGGFPRVQFHVKTATGWQAEAGFETGDLQVFFRTPLAIDGDRAISGCPEANNLAGRASVYDRSGGTWTRAELVPTQPGFADFFGTSVDVSDDVAVVGASHNGPDGFGDQLARTHVFEFDGVAWNEVAALPYYGAALDVDRGTLVVGDSRAAPGAVYVFRRIAGAWTLTDQIAGPPGTPYLGSAVSLEGDTLAVGAAFPWTGSGYVKVFRELAGVGWVETEHLAPVPGAPYDRFGESIDLSGSTLLVGAPGAGSGSTGHVHRYERAAGGFVEVARFAPEGALAQYFGETVAVAGEDAIVGATASVSFYRLGFEDLRRFCPTTPNSTGAAGVLRVEGCDSLAGGALTLVASALPPSALGLTFFGANATEVPFGHGFRCIAAPILRLPSGLADAAGVLVHDVDFSSPAAQSLTAGHTWHFQTCHRDAGAAGGGLNLTNALAIGITP